MSEVNQWPRCTTLRQVRDHFVGHPERLAWRTNTGPWGEYRRPTAFSPETGNRCPLGMIYKDEHGVAVEGIPGADSISRKLGISSLGSLVFWHDRDGCDPSKWPVELASDEILDREWA